MLELLDVEAGATGCSTSAPGRGGPRRSSRASPDPTAPWWAERLPELVEFGAANVEGAGMPWAHVERPLPSRWERPTARRSDRILVSADAEVPLQELLDQLAPGGVLAVPVGGRMARAEKGPSGVEVREVGYYRFVPLVRDG